VKPENKIYEDFKRFSQFIPYEGENDLLILKGHLLVEELLSELIKHFLSKGNPLGIKLEKNMMFAQKLNLCWALIGNKIDNQQWENLKKLNVLRNSMSHSLEPKDFNEKIETFTTAVLTSKKVKYHIEEMTKHSKFRVSMYEGKELYFAVSWITTSLSTELYSIKTNL
jgi:hypothetical protein